MPNHSPPSSASSSPEGHQDPPQLPLPGAADEDKVLEIVVKSEKIVKLPLVLCRNPIERGRSSWWPSATCSAWRWGRRRCLLPGMGCCCYWRFWCTTKSSSCLVNIINVIHNSPWSMPIHVKNFFFVSWTWARVSLFFQLTKRVTPCESIIGNCIPDIIPSSLTWRPSQEQR